MGFDYPSEFARPYETTCGYGPWSVKNLDGNQGLNSIGLHNSVWRGRLRCKQGGRWTGLPLFQGHFAPQIGLPRQTLRAK